MEKVTLRLALSALCFIGIAAMTGCSSMKTPATVEVAVSKEAVSNAADAGAAQYAPIELKSAQDKLVAANNAMAAKNYALARDLAAQAQVDAKLAQSKANSAKAIASANAVQDDIRVLREELDRAGKQ